MPANNPVSMPGEVNWLGRFIVSIPYRRRLSAIAKNSNTAKYPTQKTRSAWKLARWLSVKSAATAQATSPNATPSANGQAPANPPFKPRANNATHAVLGVRNGKTARHYKALFHWLLLSLNWQPFLKYMVGGKSGQIFCSNRFCSPSISWGKKIKNKSSDLENI